jgi:hypothetical protein
MAFFHLLGRGKRAQPKFFDTERTVIVRIELQHGVLLLLHSQHFHCELFEGEQHLRFVGQKKFNVPTAEFYDNIRILNIRVNRLGRLNNPLKLKASVLRKRAEEGVDLRACRGDCIFLASTLLPGIALHRRSFYFNRLWKRHTPVDEPLLHDTYYVSG